LHGDPGWGYLAFFYPPFFLLLCAPLALLGYMPALVVWLLGTLAGYVAAVRALLPKSVTDGEPVWLILLGYPAVTVNAGFGQNGFLSAALLGGAAVWLERRPVFAGICFGCLAYKPQLGIIVPLALAVARRWRCFAAAAVTVIALSLVATVALGWSIWPEFLAGMSDARRDWMEPPNPLYLQFWITMFGAVRWRTDCRPWSPSRPRRSSSMRYRKGVCGPAALKWRPSPPAFRSVRPSCWNMIWSFSQYRWRG
jgi:hypothetical protein